MSKSRDGSEVWQLRSRGEVVARIHVQASDFPWLVGRFDPEPGFADLKPLFDHEVALVDSGNDMDYDAWEAVQHQIDQLTSLIKPDGRQVTDFVLHIRGDEASFRWLDELPAE